MVTGYWYRTCKVDGKPLDNKVCKYTSMMPPARPFFFINTVVVSDAGKIEIISSIQRLPRFFRAAHYANRR